MFTRKAAKIVKPRRGYFKLPATTENQSWLGASSVFCQYNYSAERPFTLPYVPERPSSANYALTIKYRTGSNVTRYRLWDHQNVLPQIPFYKNELIKPNFCLELWSLEGQLGTVTPEFIFPTGLRKVPTDYRNTTGYYGTTEPEKAILTTEILRELTTTNMTYWYVGDDLPENPSNWPAHQSIGATLTPNPGPFQRDFIIKPRTQFYAGKTSGSTQYLTSGTSNNYFHQNVLLVFKGLGLGSYIFFTDALPEQASILVLFDIDMISVKWFNQDFVYTHSVDDSIFNALGDFVLLSMKSGPTYYNHPYSYIDRTVSLYKMDGTLLYEETKQTSAVAQQAPIYIGSGPNEDSGVLVAELQGYNANVTDEEFENARQYLFQKYHKGTHLNAPEFHPSAIWLDNPETQIQPDIDVRDVAVVTQDNFKDVVYLRNNADGKYYAVQLTTIDGKTTVTVGNTPYDKPA